MLRKSHFPPNTYRSTKVSNSHSPTDLRSLPTTHRAYNSPSPAERMTRTCTPRRDRHPRDTRVSRYRNILAVDDPRARARPRLFVTTRAHICRKASALMVPAREKREPRRLISARRAAICAEGTVSKTRGRAQSPLMLPPLLPPLNNS